MIDPDVLAEALVNSLFERMDVDVPIGVARLVVKDLAEASPPVAPKPQHALVLIGSTANSESSESTLFVRDLQSEAVFKIQGVRV